jgi:sensor histidine kinase YesM
VWIQALETLAITHRLDGAPQFFGEIVDSSLFTLTFIYILLLYVPFTAVCFLYYILVIDKEERKTLMASGFSEVLLSAGVLLSIFLLILINTQGFQGTIRNVFKLLLFAGFFYFNALVFVKELFREKSIEKYLLLVFLSFILVLAGTASIYGLDILMRNKYENVFNIGIFFFILFSLSLIYGYIRLKMKADETVFSLKLRAKESELNLLKSQVNPHFLFNTLNTLYATALEEQAPKTAESTAKLANLIRYMQNDIQKDFIPLQNEIKYLEDYITIQKLRCEVPPEITTSFKNIEDKIISPGLLIPFVENAFKYGIDPTIQSELAVSVICNEQTIHFECTNSYEDEFAKFDREQGFGIGIKNTRKRLELVYPKTHTLSITKTKNIFSVKLSIISKTN